jgi:hypothetical protein
LVAQTLLVTIARTIKRWARKSIADKESSMSSSWHGGKGDAPRKGADRKAYEDNWERIFGKKDKDKDTKEEKKDK